MTPGTYLRKRREAARLGLLQAARNLAMLPWAIRPVGTREIARLAIRLGSAEDDTAPFSLDHARLLRNVFAFDLGVYEQLLAVHADPGNPDLPRPPVCRGCACSWNEACADDRGPCSWVEQPSATADGLCTVCLRRTCPGPVERMDPTAGPGPNVALKSGFGSAGAASANARRPVRPEAGPGGCPAPAPEAQARGALA